MSDARGYSYALVKAILAADSKLLGVQLGRMCVERDIPVMHVAKQFGVTRQTVYWWFTGKYKPTRQFVDGITQMLEAHQKDRV